MLTHQASPYWAIKYLKTRFKTLIFVIIDDNALCMFSSTVKKKV